MFSICQLIPTFIIIKGMLTFAQQQKILTPILTKPTNKHCADCNSSSPTWASLDFGVFVCSNCSGAHRALGPTITRIKSVKLDQWWQVWLDNMYVGNQEINLYWEGLGDIADTRRPNSDSSPKEFCKFVEDKYVKKKFVKDKSMVDPLTAYKQGLTLPSAVGVQKKQINIAQIRPNQLGDGKYKQCVDLLDFEMIGEKMENKINQENYSTKSQDDDDEFDDFVEPVQPTSTKNNTNNTPDLINFDDLLKSANQPPLQPQNQFNQPPLQPQNQFNQPPPQLQNQFNQPPLQPQNQFNQPPLQLPNHFHQHWQHNPYIGYNHMHSQASVHRSNQASVQQSNPYVQSPNPSYCNFTLN